MSKDLIFAMNLSRIGKSLHRISHDFLLNKPVAEDDYTNLFKSLNKISSDLRNARMEYCDNTVKFLQEGMQLK